MNAVLAALLVLALSIVPAVAEDALVDGGLSPDGRFEVRIAHDPNRDPSDYAIHIHAAQNNTPLYSLKETGGYYRYDAAKQNCRAVWHPSSHFVVISECKHRTSREIYLFEVTATAVTPLRIPDYVQNALGRVNATQIYLHCFSWPKSWTNDDLTLSLLFSATTPELGVHKYACDVNLHLRHGLNAHSYIELTQVTHPKKTEGDDP
jgi:hypothetical protein